MVKCPKYQDSVMCETGNELNKTCQHCDKNNKGYTPAPAVPEAPRENNTKEDKIRAGMDKVLKIFESENLEIIERAVFKNPEGFSRPSDNWSFFNKILMLCNDTEDARGYRQWEAAGRHVKKGTHALHILAPKVRKIEDKKTEEEKTIITGFTTVPVFRYEDTEGEDLPECPKFEFNIPADFTGIVNELGLTVKTMGFTGNGYGFYSSSQKIIGMATPEVKTFFHELSHAVDDKLKGGLKPGQRNDQEVVAEFSGAVIGHLMGYKIPFGNVKKYIESYSFKELLQQLNRCEKVITYIISRTTNGAPIKSAV